MITLEALQAIDSIDRKGSFAAAAEELYRVPSAITYTVKRTEEQLNIKLFDRRGQRATLTPAGKLVLARGRDILQQVRRLEEQAKEIEDGCESQLRIVVDTILPLGKLWPLVKELQSQYQWLSIQLMEEALSGAWETLVNDRADLLVGATGDEPVGGHWHKQSLGEMHMRLYCSPEHPAADLAQPIKHEQLQGFTHIIVSDSARHLPARNVDMLDLKQVLAVDTLTLKYEALINGIGISHLPPHLGQQGLEKNRLTELTLATEHFPQPLFMAWPKQGTGKLNQWLREQLVKEDIFQLRT